MRSSIFYFFTCFFMATFLASCATPTTAPTPRAKSLYTFIDSTLYFNERKSSISMRARFDKGNNTQITKGYLFQFRTITEQPIFLSSVSIIAGGKRLLLEEGQLLLSAQNNVTLDLSLEDSLFTANFSSVLFQFKQNKVSEVFVIELHQLDKFSPNENI
jgi:hypothetical protein